MNEVLDGLVDALVNKLVQQALKVSLMPDSDLVLGIPLRDSPLVPNSHLDSHLQKELQKGIPLDKLQDDHTFRQVLRLRGGGGTKASTKTKTKVSTKVKKREPKKGKTVSKKKEKAEKRADPKKR